LLSFDQARDIILDHVRPLGTERVSLLDAAGRVLAEPFSAPWGLPRWDNSAMDGFAVRSRDCAENAELKVTGYLPAGHPGGSRPLEPMEAVRIMTGAPVPDGADAVVPVEDCAEESGFVFIEGKVRPGAHIRFASEDVREGELLLPVGTLLRPPEIGMLGTFGKLMVPVYRRPKVAILSTGDELREPGEPLGPGQIVNSNSLSLVAALKELGAEPLLLGIARDNRESHLEKMTEGLKADALITSAGVSAGDRDLVREVLAELGVTSVFWKINIKPGRPTAFGMYGEQPVFSLPGNPVATMIIFETLVKPALLRMMGYRRVKPALLLARLCEPVRKTAGRTQMQRVQLLSRDGRLHATGSGDQNTGILKSMVRADALAILEEDRTSYEAGDEVQVLPLGPAAAMLQP